LAETEAPGVKARDAADRDTPARSAASHSVTGIASPAALSFAPATLLPLSKVLDQQATTRFGVQ
jgi:hypothetical protein